MYENETISLPTLKPEVPGGRPAARAVREMDLDVGCPNSLFVCLFVCADDPALKIRAVVSLSMYDR